MSTQLARGEVHGLTLLQDNPDAQVQPSYKQALSDMGIEPCNLTPQYTDDTQPVDGGLEALSKVYMGEEMDK